MRAWLNTILSFIGTESLSDFEWNGISDNVGESQTYTLLVYNNLKWVLDQRESISNTHDRLKYLFMAGGVALETTPAVKPVSNILLGGGV